MLGSVARQMTLHSIIYKRKKGLLQPAHDGGKPLNQAVSALLPTGNRARTAYLHCIKLSTNIDPCCGSGGMFVQSQKFVEEHRGKKDDIHIFGQEFTATTWRLCKMNLAIRGIDGDLGKRDADTFGNDLHKNLRADFILANPPFNVSDYTLIQDDARWRYGIPPANNANYAWITHHQQAFSYRCGRFCDG